MLDTIKLGIPLTQSQHRRIQSLVNDDAWQWVLLNPSSGDLLFRRFKGQAKTDGESFHREIRWEIPCDYIESECRLSLEFSVPKFWYGHNIHLLYDFATPLEHLRTLLNQQFGFKGRGQLIHSTHWHVSRADFCYAWRFPSQRLAQQFLNSLKRLHFPRKQPIIYDDSIMFTGKTYSVKVYLKLPEFKRHDRKEMLKGNTSLEYVNYCESLADGVLRFEVTARRQFLKRHGVQTVNDLIQPVRYVQWGEGTSFTSDAAKGWAITVALWLHWVPSKSNGDEEDMWSWLLRQDALLNGEWGETIYDGLSVTLPPWDASRSSLSPEQFDIARKFLGVDGIEETTITFREKYNPTAIAQFLLTKFVGENAGMQRADEIKSKLLESYKPVKAARLVSFWLYVQKFGSSEAKEIFGKNSYYTSKADLKKAGVTLIEPPSGNNVTVLDRDFIQSFKMEIPSQFVTNRVDDFRDSGNILNLFPQKPASDAS